MYLLKYFIKDGNLQFLNRCCRIGTFMVVPMKNAIFWDIALCRHDSQLLMLFLARRFFLLWNRCDTFPQNVGYHKRHHIPEDGVLHEVLLLSDNWTMHNVKVGKPKHYHYFTYSKILKKILNCFTMPQSAIFSIT
jgi:hypothetical protein